jgi:hypothetical protein
MTKKHPDPLRLESGRDPLAGLENHPLFRDLPSDTDSDHADAKALQLTQARLRKAEEQIVRLHEQLAATAAEKRRLFRQIDELQDRLSSKREWTTVSPADLEAYEAFFTGELESMKVTFNDIPVELKAFLTSTKARFQAEFGLRLTERDQVVCALAIWQMVMSSLPDPHAIIDSPSGHPRERASIGFCTRLLAELLIRLSHG